MIWGKKKQPRNSSVKTLISRQTEVQGDVRFSDGMYIEGTIKGNVIAEDENSLLILNENGTIEGEVKVPYVKLNGVVIGDVYVSEHVELMSKARITGNVYYNLIEMAIGAEVNGKLVHSQESEDVPLAIANSTEALEVTE
ncbi:MAG: polymer-forming cytoskeletal protein [Gammaproteobacteria bacterium]|nr:polymer-forming cytoskeletal protein [Gammaproteobacteria bacterium]